MALDNKANCLEGDKKYEEAISLGERSLVISQKLGNLNSVGITKVSLVRRLAKAKSCDKALQLAKEIREQKVFPVDAYRSAEAYAEALHCANHLTESQQLYEQIIPIGISKDSGGQSVVPSMETYLDMLLENKNPDHAEKQIEKYYELCLKSSLNNKETCEYIDSMRIKVVAYRLAPTLSADQQELLKQVIKSDRWGKRAISFQKLTASMDARLLPLIEAALHNNYSGISSIAIHRVPLYIASLSKQGTPVTEEVKNRLYSQVEKLFRTDPDSDVKISALNALWSGERGLGKIRRDEVLNFYREYGFDTEKVSEILLSSADVEVAEIAQHFIGKKRTNMPSSLWVLEEYNGSERSRLQDILSVLMEVIMPGSYLSARSAFNNSNRAAL